MTTERYDVVVLGGGAAGLTLALQLVMARPQTSVLVVEKKAHPVPEATHKVGESTVEIAAHYLRDELGLGEHLRAEQLPKFGLRMFFSHDGNTDITRRVELGHAAPPPQGVGTYQLDRGRLENALGRELDARGIAFRSGVTVTGFDLRPDTATHLVRVRADDGAASDIEARWVVDASGRTALLKRRLGLARTASHRANAAWFRIARSVDVDTWSDDPVWRGRIREGRRALSTNHLMGPGYWVWLIPLASGSTSVGIVTDAATHDLAATNRLDRALDWLRAHEPQLADEIAAHVDDVQDFRVMRDYSYGCAQVFSADRWALAGESGIFLDPLYSPGLDLIAVGNGLVTDLVTRALDGEDGDDLDDRAAIHNQMFLVLTDGWFHVYRDQYALMDNARIMLAKVVWDTAVYWAVPGLLYFHDMIRRLAEHPGVVIDLARFSVVAERTQRFFREWHALDRSVSADAFVGFYDVDFMAGLHLGMTAGLADDELRERFAANVRFIEQLTGQLVATVLAEYTDDPDPVVAEQVRRWRADVALTRLVAVHEQDGAAAPTSDRWLTLGTAGPQRAEVAS